MDNKKDFLSSIVAYISIAIAILQVVMMVYNNWIATITSTPTVTEYIQLVILISLGVVGVLTGKNADGTKKSEMQIIKQADPVPPVVKVIALILLLGFASTVQAQGFDNFWHPRPKQLPTQFAPASGGPIVVIGGSIFEFKPTARLQVTEVAFGLNGVKTAASFLDAVGIALTMQHSTQDANGVNYADWSASLAFLMTGTTTQAPVFSEEIALTAGFFNNLLQVGPGYIIGAVDPDYSRLRLHFGIGVNLTNN